MNMHSLNTIKLKKELCLEAVLKNREKTEQFINKWWFNESSSAEDAERMRFNELNISKYDDVRHSLDNQIIVAIHYN